MLGVFRWRDKMPIYEYRCLDCAQVFEKIIWNTQNETVCCPSCQGDKVLRLLSAFSSGSPRGGQGVSLPSTCGPSSSGFS